jgi:integrase
MKAIDKLSQDTVGDLELPEGIEARILYDRPHFGVLVRRAKGCKTGPVVSRTYVVRYKNDIGQTKTPRIADVNAITLKAARAAALELLGDVAKRKDPLAEQIEARKKKGETFGNQYPLYLADKKRLVKFSTYNGIERNLGRYCAALHPLVLDRIRPEDIGRVLNDIKGKAAKVYQTDGTVAKRHARSALSDFFEWCRGSGGGYLVKTNPVGRGDVREPKRIEQRIPFEDAIELYDAAQGMGHYTAILRLIFLTAARKNMIAAMRHSWIDWDAGLITIPGEFMKNNTTFLIAITPAVKAELLPYAHPHIGGNGKPRDLVFGYYSDEERPQASGLTNWTVLQRKLMAKINAARAAAGAEPMKPWKLHNIRHTFSTLMNKPHGEKSDDNRAIVVEECLSHITHKSGVRGVYCETDYIEEKTAMWETWQKFIKTALKARHPVVIVPNVAEHHAIDMDDRAKQLGPGAKYVVRLTIEERAFLEQLVINAHTPRRRVLKAKVLLKADRGEAGEGWSDTRIFTTFNTSDTLLHRVRKSFAEGGIEAALADKMQPLLSVVPGKTLPETEGAALSPQERAWNTRRKRAQS